MNRLHVELEPPRERELTCDRMGKAAVPRPCLEDTPLPQPSDSRLFVDDGTDFERTRVFISYSRLDLAFAERLRDALNAGGVSAFLDTVDIKPGDPWHERLTDFISEADAVVFALSPEAVESTYCAWEVDQAERMAKRVFPVIARPTPDAAIPERLGARNYVDLSDSTTWDERLPMLLEALRRDNEWTRAFARLVAQARVWEKQGTRAQLLGMEGVNEAQLLLDRWPEGYKARTPDVLSTFLHASRERAQESLDAMRRAVGRGFVEPARNAADEGHPERVSRLVAAGALLSEDRSLALDAPHPLWTVALALTNHEFPQWVVGRGSQLQAWEMSPDGTKLATQATDGTCRIYDTASYSEIGQFESRGVALVWSPDGRWLAAGARDFLSLYDMQSRELHRRTPSTGDAMYLTWSSRGQLASYSTGDGLVRVWDPGRSAPVHTFRPPDMRHPGVSWSADGRRLLVDSVFESVARVHDLDDGSVEAFQTSEHGSPGASFSPDNRFLALRGSTFRVVSLASGDTVFRLNVTFDYFHWEWSPDGRRLLVYGGREGKLELCMLEVDGWSQVSVHEGGSSRGWSPLGDRYAIELSGGALRLWSGDDTDPVVLPGAGAALAAVAWAPDGRRLATADAAGRVRLWRSDAAVVTAEWTGHEQPVVGLWWWPDGSRVVSVEESSRTLRAWDAQSPRVARVPEPDPGRMWTVEFSPSGRTVALAEEPAGGLVVCESSTGAELVSFARGTVFEALAWLDEERLHAVTEDGRSEIWSLTTGQLESSESGGEGVRSPDFRRRRVLSESGVLEVWENQPSTLLYRTELCSHTCWSPDSQTLAILRLDHAIDLVDVSSGKCNRTLRGHTKRVSAMAWSPDGRRLATKSEDRALKVWDTETGAVFTEFENNWRWSIGDLWWSPTGTRLACALSHRLLVFDVPSRELAYSVDHDDDDVRKMAWSPDGLCFATAAGPRVRVFETASGGKIAQTSQSIGFVTRLAWSPDGRRLAIQPQQCRPLLWDVGFTQLVTMDPHLVLAACLARGVGVRTSEERRDLHMSNAPDDLFIGMIDGLDESERQTVEHLADVLRTPRGLPIVLLAGPTIAQSVPFTAEASSGTDVVEPAQDTTTPSAPDWLGQFASRQLEAARARAHDEEWPEAWAGFRLARTALQDPSSGFSDDSRMLTLALVGLGEAAARLGRRAEALEALGVAHRHLLETTAESPELWGAKLRCTRERADLGDDVGWGTVFDVMAEADPSRGGAEHEALILETCERHEAHFLKRTAELGEALSELRGGPSTWVQAERRLAVATRLLAQLEMGGAETDLPWLLEALAHAVLGVPRAHAPARWRRAAELLLRIIGDQMPSPYRESVRPPEWVQAVVGPDVIRQLVALGRVHLHAGQFRCTMTAARVVQWLCDTLGGDDAEWLRVRVLEEQLKVDLLSAPEAVAPGSTTAKLVRAAWKRLGEAVERLDHQGAATEEDLDVGTEAWRTLANLAEQDHDNQAVLAALERGHALQRVRLRRLIESMAERVREQAASLRTVVGAWSNDGSRFAIMAPNGEIHLLDPLTGQRVHRWPATGEGVLRWAADGQRLGSGTPDGTVAIYTIEGHLEHRWSFGGSVLDLVAAPRAGDGPDWAVTCDDGSVWLLDEHDPDPEPLREAGSLVCRSLAWSPSGDEVLLGLDDGQCLGWSRGNAWRTIGSLHGPVQRIVVAPDGGSVATTAFDGTVHVWPIADGEPKTFDGIGWRLTWSDDSEQLAVVGGHEVAVWRVRDGALVQRFDGHRDGIADLAWSVDGSIASGSRDVGVLVWDPATGSPLGGPQRGSVEYLRWIEPTRGVAYTSKGIFVRFERRVPRAIEVVPRVAWATRIGRVASAVPGGVLTLKSTITNRLRAALEPPLLLDVPGEDVLALAWSSSGQHLAAAVVDGTLRIWGVDGRPVTTLEPGDVSALAWAPEMERLVFVNEGIAREWDPHKPEQVERYWPAATSAVSELDWSTDGSLLAAGCDDGSVLVWNTTSYRLESQISSHEGRVVGLAWSPRAPLLATAGDDETLGVWDPASARRVWSVNPGSVRHVAWISGGSRLVVYTARAIEVRDVRDGNLIWSREEPITSIASSRDGAIVAAVSPTGLVQLHDVNTGESLVDYDTDNPAILDVTWSATDRLLVIDRNLEVSALGTDSTDKLRALDRHLAELTDEEAKEALGVSVSELPLQMVAGVVLAAAEATDRFRQLGRLDESRQAMKDAVAGLRSLPEDFVPMRPALERWAEGLNMLADHLMTEGLRESAAEVLGLAARYYAALDEEQPGRWAGERGFALHRLSLHHHKSGNASAALATAQEAVDAFRSAQAHYEDIDLRMELASALSTLGLRLSVLLRHHEAYEATAESVRIHRELSEEPDRDDSALMTALNNLGIRLSKLDRHDEALEVTAELLARRRQLVSRGELDEGKLAGDLHNLSLRFLKLDRLDDALQAATDAVELYESSGDGQGTARAYHQRANVRRQLGDAEAREDMNRAVEQFRDNVRRGDRLGRPELGRALLLAATISEAAGDREAAVSELEEACSLFQELATEEPELYSLHVGNALRRLGGLHQTLGRLNQAIQATEASITHLRQISMVPVVNRSELAQSLHNLAWLLLRADRATEAIAPAEEALALHRQLERETSRNAGPVGSTLVTLAQILHATGASGEALRVAQEASAVWEAQLPAPGVIDRFGQAVTDLLGYAWAVGDEDLGLAHSEQAASRLRSLVEQGRPRARERLATLLESTLDRVAGLGGATVEYAAIRHRLVADDRLPLAERLLAEATELRRGSDDRGLIGTLQRQTMLAVVRGDHQAALAFDQERLERLSRLELSDATYYIAGSTGNLAVRFAEVGDTQQALALSRRAIELVQSLKDQTATRVRASLARNFENLGLWQSGLPRREARLALSFSVPPREPVGGDLDGARASFERSIELRRRLLETSPDETLHLARSLDNLGVVLAAQGDVAAALEAATEATRLNRELLDVSREVVDLALAGSRLHQSVLFEAQGDDEQAIDASADAVERLREAARVDPERWQGVLEEGLRVHTRQLDAAR